VLLPRLRRDIGLLGSFPKDKGGVADIRQWRSAPKRRLARGGNLFGGAWARRFRHGCRWTKVVGIRHMYNNFGCRPYWRRVSTIIGIPDAAAGTVEKRQSERIRVYAFVDHNSQSMRTFLSCYDQIYENKGQERSLTSVAKSLVPSRIDIGWACLGAATVLRRTSIEIWILREPTKGTYVWSGRLVRTRQEDAVFCSMLPQESNIFLIRLCAQRCNVLL
jgi:hypothetical protein